MLRGFIIALDCCVCSCCLAADPPPAVDGNSSIRGGAGLTEIVITTTDRVAGAIHSLTWGGKEFIDSYDHGRQLQSASSFDLALPGEFWAECYNPTEAGSRLDGAGDHSSSRLLSLKVEGPELRTTSQMAFWLAPGEQSSNWPALNTMALSEHLISKRVHIGHKTLDQVIEYEVTFRVPECERHTLAQFEAVTGYMPYEFGKFWKFVPHTGELEELDDGPGEQRFPVLLANDEGTHAMGVFSPDQPSLGYESAGYGRFRFPEERVVKWNCVFRSRNPNGIPPGDHRFRTFVVVGSREQVRQSLSALVAEFAGR